MGVASREHAALDPAVVKLIAALTLGVLTAPPVAGAQQAGKV